jgi:hypothetical protein
LREQYVFIKAGALILGPIRLTLSIFSRKFILPISLTGIFLLLWEFFYLLRITDAESGFNTVNKLYPFDKLSQSFMMVQFNPDIS